MNALQNGRYYVGTIQNFESVPWTTDPTKFNHRLVMINQYDDRYGNSQTQYENFNVHPEDIQRIQTLANSAKGEQVIFAMGAQAKKGGKNGAWLDQYIVKGTPVYKLEEFLDSIAA